MKELETSIDKHRDHDEKSSYSPRELKLIVKTLSKWRNHRFTSLKDELLSTAVLLKVRYWTMLSSEGGCP